MMQRFDLPLCPTANNLYLNPPKPHMRRPPSRLYQDWKWAAYYDLKKQDYSRIEGKYILRIFVPDSLRYDGSNRIKAVEDFLKDWVTPDDRYCVKVSAEKRADIPAGRMAVEVEEWKA